MNKMNYLLILFLSLISCNTEVPTQFSAEALADTFITLENEEISFKEILDDNKGKTIVIDIWASWCGDCLKGLPKVKKLQEENQDVVYIFLSLDKSQSKWQNAVKKYKLKGQHYYMQSGWKGAFGTFVNLDWIPRYMVIGKEGEIKLFKAIKANDKKILEAIK